MPKGPNFDFLPEGERYFEFENPFYDRNGPE